MKKYSSLLFGGMMICLLMGSAYAQLERRDRAVFKVKTNKYYENIKKENEAFETTKKAEQPALRMDFTGIDYPKSLAEFKIIDAGKPVSQGQSGTCWCFSATSFYESEIKRLTKQDIKLSEMYTVYRQYIEKAKEYVRTRGASAFSEGAETNALPRMMKMYGIVPFSSYTGMKPGQPYVDHEKMVDEMTAYLLSVKATNAWNTDEVIATIKSILDHYLGEPPATITVDGKKMTPQEYLKNVTKINPDDYVDLMSFMEAPYWTKAEYRVPDNWWHSKDYYNVPLNDFMTVIKNALKNGYSMAIGGDVSESGIDNHLGVMMIPTYDIPSAYIDENARQMRFSNGSTTDDHGMHLIGYVEKANGTWFLIKDSGSGGHNNETAPGYWYVHEDYVKLKMTTITLHKDAVKDLLPRFAEK